MKQTKNTNNTGYVQIAKSTGELRAVRHKIMLYIALCLIAVPGAIMATTLIEGVDESGIGTTLAFIFIGIPCGLLGLILMLVAMVRSKINTPLISVDAKADPKDNILKKLLEGALLAFVGVMLLFVFYIILNLVVSSLEG